MIPPESIKALMDILGVSNMAYHPGVWTHWISRAWTIAYNPHAEMLPVEPSDCEWANIAPFQYVIWYYGHVAAQFYKSSGEFFPASGADPAKFAAAITLHIEMLQR